MTNGDKIRSMTDEELREKVWINEAVEMVMERWMRCMTPRTDSDKKCENCKWNNLFWKESGCSKFNAMEPCKFEPKEALKDGKGD